MAPDFRICPQCSTRNRLDKEFCVKCGEPLEGVKAGDPAAAAAAAAAKKRKPGFVVSGKESAQSPIIPLLLVLLTLGSLYGAWNVLQSAPEAAPTTAPRPLGPAVAPSSSPLPAAPGLEHYSAGVAALRAGDFKTAVARLRLAVAAANRADYRATLAEALEKSGATTEALVEYEAATALDRANVQYVSQWARALNRAGRNTEAIRAYNTALTLDGENVALLREISALVQKGADPTQARPYLVKIVALQPDDLIPKQELAQVLEASNDLPGAVTQYLSILALMPGAHVSRALLSEVYMKQNRPADALKVLDEGLSASPTAALLFREKGRVLDRMGRNQEAIAAYREFLRLDPASAEARVFTDRIQQLSTPVGQ